MNSIKSKILTFAVLATLIPAIGLGLLSFWRFQVVISDNVSHELRTLASDAGGELAVWLRERGNEIRALSTAYTLIDGLADEIEPPAGRAGIGKREMEHYLHAVQEKLDPLLELTLVDASGNVVASSASMPAPIALPATWPTRAITEGVILDLPRRDGARATATVTVVVPVLSLHNEMLGALAAVLDLAAFRPRLVNIAANSSAELILLTPSGTPLLATRSDAASLADFDPHVLQRLRAGPEVPLTFAGPDQREVIGVGAASRSLPFVFVAQRDRVDVYAEWLNLLELFLLLVGGLTLLVGVFAYWMGRSIVTPLDRLTAAADGIAHGDLTVRLQDAHAGEIGHLTRVFNLMTDRLRESHSRLLATGRTLQTQNQLLAALAVTDGLTGLYNRKKLDEILVDQIARFRRNGRPFAVLMLDLDNFKAINDGHGHGAGDEVLRTVAAILKQSVRAIDFVARYGGEEFVLVLVETPLGAALDVAERIRSEVEVTRFTAGDRTIAVTVSLGVTHCGDDSEGPEALLARADRALYQAKHAGRNQVQHAL